MLYKIHPTMERRVKIEVYSEWREEELQEKMKQEAREKKERARQKKLNSYDYRIEDGLRFEAIFNTIDFDKEGTGQFLEEYEGGYQERRRLGIAPELEPSEWIEDFYKQHGISQDKVRERQRISKLEMKEDDIITNEQKSSGNSERCIMCGETLPLIASHCDACGYLNA
jgi:hypothetical protein